MDNLVIKEFLRKVELFEGFDEKELDIVSSLMKFNDIEKDSLIFSENNPRNYVYMIFSGEIELFQRTPYGRETRLSYFSNQKNKYKN